MAKKRTAAALHLLTVREVQNAPDGDHSDGGGLLLRVRGESASWVLRYTAQTGRQIGRRREMGLGVARRGSAAQAGESLTLARKLARNARDLVQSGGDPIDDRDHMRKTAKLAEVETKAKKERELKREYRTLARAAREYHERAIEPSLTSKHAAQWIASLENHVPAEVWHKPIADIDAPGLFAALSAVRSLEKDGERVPETLKRVRQRLDAIFEDAIFHGHCTTNAARAILRKMRKELPGKAPGEFAALDYREAPAFMAKLREAQGTAARCLEFAMLTAARTGEVLNAVWGEFDLDGAAWLVPGERMKSSGKPVGEDHLVHLTPRALQILIEQRGQDASLVFPSTVLEGKPQSNMAMLAVLDRLGMRATRDKAGKLVSGTTVHGLCRASFSTWANETGAARPDVIEACLAHREVDRVRAAYNRAKFTEERRALMVAWAEYLATPRGQVLPFERAA